MLAEPVFPCLVPGIDLQADEYADDDDQNFQDDREPVLLAKRLSQVAQDYRFSSAFSFFYFAAQAQLLQVTKAQLLQVIEWNVSQVDRADCQRCVGFIDRDDCKQIAADRVDDFANIAIAF